MEKTFLYQQFNIHYTDTGSGIPVLLLHGFGEDSRIWNQQAAFLSTHCRLIIPDLPGSGASLPLTDDTKLVLAGVPSSIESMADAIAALVANENIAPFVLLGHSMGGYISLAFAEKHPDKLSGLGLIHSSAFADNEDKKATRRKAIGFIEKNDGYAFLQTAIPGLFSETFIDKQPATVKALIEQFNPGIINKNTLSATLVAYYQAMIARPDRTGVLESSKVPVLFIIGTEDKAVPMQDVLKQVALPEKSYVHIIEGVGHMSMLEATEKLNNHLLSFIQDLQPANQNN